MIGNSKIRSVLQKHQWLLAAIVFALCAGPTFISYRPYVFRWDDAGYLGNAIAVSRALWASNVHGVAHLRQIAGAMYSIRPPAMRLLGVPWGSLTSWDAAGKCFLTLATLISFFAGFCLFLMARIGVRPIFLVLASMCTFASLGPIPPSSSTNRLATSFMADSLFAWITLAALLLIAYEARTQSSSIWRSWLRGILWGLILSAGAMTKMDFLYFVAVLVPVLLAIRFRHSGLRAASFALLGLACSSAPAAAYLLKYGGLAFANGKESSFGGVAQFYNVPFPQFLWDSVRQSPGLALFLVSVVTALAYLFVKERSMLRRPEAFAVLFPMIFAVIVLASANRQIRYSFPVIVALPFLLAVILSGEGISIPPKPALLASGLVFSALALAALPTMGRAQRQASLSRADSVLAEAVKCNDRKILLATDSPTLNEPLLVLSNQVASVAPTIAIRSLTYSAMSDVLIDVDFRTIQDSDLVVFQDDSALSPPFTNERVAEYRRFIHQQNNYIRVKLGGEVTAFVRQCRL